MDVTGEVVKRVEYEFPKLKDDRLNAILSSVNTEPKNITLAFCLDRQPKTQHDLRNDFSYYVDEKTHWVPVERSFSNYSRKSFTPIGMVAEEIIRIKGKLNPTYHWMITDCGEKYGKPISAFSLKYAVDNGESLFKYFGQVPSSGESRAPFNRVRVLDALNEKKKMKEINLWYELDLNQENVQRHVKKLNEIGLVEYLNETEVEITTKGEGFVEDFVNPVKDALNDGDSLIEMTDILESFQEGNVERSLYCNTAMDLYRKVSPSQKSKSKEERNLEVLYVIKWFTDRGKRPRPVEIKEKTGMAPDHYLSSLYKQEMVDKRKNNKRGVEYYLTEKGKKMV